MFSVQVFILLFCAVVTSAENQVVCSKKSCQQSAYILKSCINESVDPCDNFYQFACGNFGKTTGKYHGESEVYSWFDYVEAKIKTKITEILTTNVSMEDPDAIKKAKLFYKTCMDTDSMNKAGLQPMIDVLTELGLSIQPPFSKASSNIDLTTTMAKMNKLLNKYFLIGISVVQDPLNRTLNRITIYNPTSYDPYSPLIPKSGNENIRLHAYSNRVNRLQNKATSQKLQYESFIRNLSNLILKDSKDDDNLLDVFLEYATGITRIMYKAANKKYTKSQKKLSRKGIAELLVFMNEKSMLINKVWPDDSNLPTAMTIKQLQNFTNTFIADGNRQQVFNWKKYFKVLFDDLYPDIDYNNEIIIVINQEYLGNALRLLSENTKVIEKTFWWEVVSSLTPFTTNEMRKLISELDSKIFESPTPWSEKCVSLVRDNMGMALAYNFLDDPTVYNYKKQVSDMLDNIQQAFEAVVTRLDWMDNETINAIVEKTKIMKKYVAFPSWLRNKTQLDEYYDDIEIYEKKMLYTLLTIERNISLSGLSSLRDVNNINDDEFASDPLDVNAYYTVNTNSMTIPLAILNLPFYGHTIQALNYGAIGTIIGHEITHGFDNEGRRHDSLGNLNIFWKNNTLQEYNKRSKCFSESYGNIDVAGKLVDGNVTLNENIADNGGLRAALVAYKIYTDKYGQESLLQGFENYTHPQLLTLSFANIWCEYNTEVDKEDEHSPSEARVRGALMNSKEFAEIWKCGKGTRMNPANKCQIW